MLVLEHNLFMKRSTSLLVLALLSGFASAQTVPDSTKQAVATADAAIAKLIAIPASERNFDNTLGAFDKLQKDLDDATSMTMFLMNVSTSAAERDAGQAAEEFVSNWYIEVSKREDLFQAIKAYADTKPTLTGEQKRFLEFTMRDYHRSGMDLPKEKRDRLKDIDKELNKLGLDFEQNIRDDQSKVPLTEAELKGAPADVLKSQPKFGNVYLINLDAPTYGALMDYCTEDVTRQKLQWINRRKGGSKNVDVLEKMLVLRDEEARILSYKNLVDYAVDVRMAKNSGNIAAFYKNLQPVVRKKALVDFAEMTAAKRDFTHNKKAELMPWDWSFYQNLMLKKKYAVDSQKVMEYFSVDNVIKGLFQVNSTLYNVSYSDVTSQAKSMNLPLWHPDVKLFQVKDNASGKVLGHVYMDLYPRDNKYNHAACWGLKVHRINEDGTISLPLAALVTNFNKPTPGKPALMSHDQVETLFHEFGHGMHGILSNTRYARFAGTSVAQDFVEAPSQIMENWVWEPSVLKLFAKHYKTGQPLPAAMLESMRKARTLNSGLDTEGQMFLGMMDQAYHTAAGGKIDTTKAAYDVYDKVTLWKHVPGTFPQASFGHLVGYEGAYYGYLWSKVYAQAMFDVFKKKGILNPEVGKLYRDKILSRGGSMDELSMVRDFIGGEPNMNAFLRDLGLDK